MRLLTTLLLASLLSDCYGQQEKLNSNLRSYVSFRGENDRYSGITTIYKSDKIIFEHVEGIANKSWEIKVSEDTKFNLASVTKMFTATAIGVLIDRNEIDIKKTIEDYFPEFPIKEISEKITIKQLLSHTSGISDFFFEEAYLNFDKTRLRKLEDYDVFYNTLRLGDVPENQISYSNTNYIILGRIIEKITNTSYYDFCDEVIFSRAGMSNTGFFESDIPVKKLAEGYFQNDPQATSEFGVPNDGRVRRNTLIRAVKGMPAGGAFSTSYDMNLFLNSLRNGTLVAEDTYKLLTSPVKPGYAPGFQSYDYNGIKVIGHSGGFYGVSTMVFYLPDYDYNFISLTNNSFGAQPVFDRFINLLNKEETYEPILMTEEQLQKFDGYYEVYQGDMSGRQIKISAENNKLVFDESFRLDFFPISDNKFFDIDNDFFTIEFIYDENGKIIEFIRTDNRNYIQKAKKITDDQVKSIQALNIGDDVLAQFKGSYQFEEGGMMPGHKPSIEIRNGALFIDNAMKFLPYDMDKFFLEDDQGMQLHFQRNKNGEITGIHVIREKQIIGQVKRLD